MQQRNCPVCGGRQTDAYLDKGELKLVRCQVCRMVFANPVPGEYATGEYYDAEGQRFYLSEAKLAGDYAPVRFERELKIFRNWARGGDVLDVGCSSGGFLFQLQNRFAGDYRAVGTDVSKAPLDYAESRGVRVIRDNFLSHDFSGQQFDAVTFWAVLEHVPDPAAFLARASVLLRCGGLCFVLVPNMESMAVRWLGRRYRYIYPQHVNYWTAATLRRSLEPTFHVEELRSTHFNPVVIWQDFRNGGREVTNQERAGLLRRTTGLKQNPWLRPLKLLYGMVERGLGSFGAADNLIAIARKP